MNNRRFKNALFCYIKRSGYKLSRKTMKKFVDILIIFVIAQTNNNNSADYKMFIVSECFFD